MLDSPPVATHSKVGSAATLMAVLPIYTSMKGVHIVLVGCVLFSAEMRVHAGQRKPTPTPRVSPALTTLRAEQPQVLLSGKSGALETRLVSVRVRNVGSSDAKQIQVALEVASGLAVPLRGPKNLRAHASGLYSSSSRLPGVLYRLPQITATCETCRN